MRAAAGNQALWPLLTAGLIGAEQGNGTLLHAMVSSVTVAPFGGPFATLQEPHTAVRCADWPEVDRLSDHHRAARTIAERHDRLGGRAAYSALSCALWPVDNRDRFTDVLDGAGAPRSSWSAAAWTTSPRTTGPRPWPSAWTTPSCSPGKASATPPTAPAARASTTPWTPC
nr:hypothetical protein GCM10025730_01120 [Promicromonospora thailandica]